MEIYAKSPHIVGSQLSIAIATNFVVEYFTYSRDLTNHEKAPKCGMIQLLINNKRVLASFFKQDQALIVKENSH